MHLYRMHHSVIVNNINFIFAVKTASFLYITNMSIYNIINAYVYSVMTRWPVHLSIASARAS